MRNNLSVMGATKHKKQLSSSTFYFLWPLLITLILTSPISDPDLWWHISIGRWISPHGSVPIVEHWNKYALGTSFSAYSWMIELLLSLVDELGGTKALYLAQAALSFIFYASLLRALGLVSASKLKAIFFTCLIALGCYPFFSLRPQTFSWLYFLALVVLTESRNSLDPSKFLASLFLIFALWANSHLTSCIGLVYLAVMLFPKNRAGLRIFFYCLLIALLGTLCTPYLGQEWFVLFSKYKHSMSERYIEEFQTANLGQISSGIGLALYLCVLLCALRKNIGQKKIAASELIFASLLCALSILSIKFSPFSLIYSGLLVARASELESTRAHLKLALCTLPLFAYGSFLVHKKDWSFEIIDREKIPEAAVNFIQENKLSLDIAHDFDTGGYLIYRFLNKDGTSKFKAMLDGRTNVNQQAVLASFLNCWQDNTCKDYLRLSRAKTVLWRKDEALSRELRGDKDWKKVYEDRAWTVFRRTER